MTPADGLWVVVGPTAAGKSALAVGLAQRGAGEVVSADSMQVYRGFDIGTGKLPVVARAGVPHHLIDVVEAKEGFSAARFVELADRAIGDIRSRARRVVVAGGTGLYVRALLRGLFDAPPPDAEIRAEHDAVRQRDGVSALYSRLQGVDPEAARRVDRNDFVRISRALEVVEQTGVPISELRDEHRFATERYRARMIGIDPGRAPLRQRIDQRVEEMMADGWLDEVRLLLDVGAGETHAMGALGYRHLRAHLRGELDLAEAVRQTKRDTWRFAKRQLNWFRQEPNVEWYSSAAAALTDIGPQI